jgi:hypothetical protein
MLSGRTNNGPMNKKERLYDQLFDSIEKINNLSIKDSRFSKAHE